ncbi:MAG: dihydroorotase [Oscillospiraceae bacterium]|jgi:dihydroorotase
MKLLIQKGRIIDPVTGIGGQLDVLIEDGILSLIASEIREPDADRLDASGLMVCAGLVDMHVHLRDPGFTHKEDLASGSAAAAKGGFTSVACMPNTQPTLDSPSRVSALRARAAQIGQVQIYPIASVSYGQLGAEMTQADALRQAGAVALSDDGMPITSANLMRDALIRAKSAGLPILSHCEDASMVDGRAVNEGPISRRLGLPGRPAIAEEIMVMRDAMLAAETGSPVHICHVSTRGSVEIIRAAKKQGVPITCETCPQYFTLTEEDILTKGSLAKVNPPLRTPDDVQAIIEGLQDDTIDVIATDHAPHAAEEKARPLADAPSGISGLETALGVTLTALYHTGKLSLSHILQKMTINPSVILGIPKGRLAIGAPGDLTLFHPSERWKVNPDEFVSKGKNTPFGGKTLTGRVKYTILNGRIVYPFTSRE